MIRHRQTKPNNELQSEFRRHLRLWLAGELDLTEQMRTPPAPEEQPPARYRPQRSEEAARRGLANLRSTADALPTYVLPKNVELMMKHGVYTKEEMLSRHEIHMEKYRKVIHIEAATMVDMVQHEILNAASEYESKLCETMLRKHEAAPELPCHVEKSLANSIGILNDKLLEQTVMLKTALETAPVGASGEEEMRYYHDVVAADMDAVRDTVDRLETLTAGKYWPYPTFYDLLFSV